MGSPSVSKFRRLLGREAQLAAAAGQLDALMRSRGSLLLLSGEAGIGKTRLAEEIVEDARERGFRTVWAMAWPGEGAPPLWPWVQVLRQLTGVSATLEQAPPEAPIDSAAARFAQLEATAGVLRGVAEEVPLVVVIDDLHWADAASTEVTTFLAGALRDAACLLVVTYRPQDLPREDAGALARVGTTLAVPGLPFDAAVALLRSSVGGAVSADATDAVVARSGGNPLFVWEFGQLMAQTGRLDVAPAAVPGAVAAVIERRLARLPEASVAVLQVVAVIGEAVPDLVGSVAEVDVVEVQAVLSPAVSAGLVVQADEHSSLVFSHDVVREVVLDGIDPRKRAELHRRTAAVLEDRVGIDPSVHAVVAEHLTRAGLAHSSAASDHWERAAAHALRVLAYHDAARSFERATGGAGDDPDRRAELLTAAGEALVLAGDLEAARVRFNDAAAAARAAANPSLLAKAVLGVGTGPAGWEVPIADAEHAEVVADALALLPADAVRLRSMLLARLSVAATTSETMEVARRRAEEAVELARQLGEPALLGQALAALNDAYGGPAHTVARRENADTIVELALTAGDRALELLGYRFRIVADLEVGDVAAVDRTIVTFARLADQLRQPLLSWYVPLFQGMRALMMADLDAADRHRAEVAAAAEATGSRNATLLAAALGFGIDVQCRRETSPDLMDEFGDVDPAEWGSFAAGLAMVSWHGGNHARARDLLDLYAATGFARLGDDSDYLVSLLCFGRVAAALGESTPAAILYELFLPHAGLWVVDGIAACCWAPVDLELGRLALTLGRDDDARMHLASARRDIERTGAAQLAEEADSLAQRCGPAERPRVQAETSDPNVFRRDGQFWTLAFEGRTVRMKHAKGVEDLARLLADPGRELHVLDLARGGTIETSGDGDAADLGELLDATARAEYRRRLAELAEELADAEACVDPERANKARDEHDFLARELSAALGLGGRPRRAGDPAERARKAVSGRIRLTIGRIEQELPTLGRHLRYAVRTGTYCAYEPETPTVWER
jgi:predicted ATPase